MLKQLVKVIVTLDNDEKEIREYKVTDLKFKLPKRAERVPMDAELHALEQLERKEAKKQGE